jgi:hypothetical protein
MLGQKAKHIEKPKRKRGEGVVHRPPTLTRAVFSIQLPFILMLALGFGRWMLYSLRTGSLFGLLFTGVFFYCTSTTIWLILNWMFIARLIVSPEGIEYHFGGYSGFAFWHDMECLGNGQTPQGETWGIVLNRRVDLSPNRVCSFLSFCGSGPDILHTFIPLSLIVSVKYEWLLSTNVDDSHFRSTSLGQDLFYYAPHLFEKSKRKAKE